MKKKYLWLIVPILCIIIALSYCKMGVFNDLNCTYAEISMYSESPIQRTLTNPKTVNKCLGVINSAVRHKNVFLKRTNHSPDISIKLFTDNGKPLQIFVYGNTILADKRQYTVDYDYLYQGLLQLEQEK